MGLILAADVGGTHARMALFSGKKLEEEQIFPSQEFRGLEEIVIAFLEKRKGAIDSACFALAGPVEEGKCIATNLPWIVDSFDLQRVCKTNNVKVINDLEANAWGIDQLEEKDLFCLQKGKQTISHRALISAGTGLGEAIVMWDLQEWKVLPSEGGHADFAPRNEMEVELFFFLQKRFGHVSYERVLSGPGIESLFEFLVLEKGEAVSLNLEAEMKQRGGAVVLSEWGSKKKDSLAMKVMDWFISLYGAEAGNLALKALARGGVYLGGGIAPHLKERLMSGAFLSSFCAKGRFSSLLQQIPIWLILNDQTALLGAASVARRHS